MGDAAKLAEILARRGDYFFHFTDTRNLPLIKQHGLLSMRRLKQEGISTIPGGNQWSLMPTSTAAWTISFIYALSASTRWSGAQGRTVASPSPGFCRSIQLSSPAPVLLSPTESQTKRERHLVRLMPCLKRLILRSYISAWTGKTLRYVVAVRLRNYTNSCS